MSFSRLVFRQKMESVCVLLCVMGTNVPLMIIFYVCFGSLDPNHFWCCVELHVVTAEANAASSQQPEMLSTSITVLNTHSHAHTHTLSHSHTQGKG